MKKLIFGAFTLLSGFSALSQITIAEAREMGIGQTVTVRGVVTNGSELGPIRYLQDGTAAIAAYGTNLNSVQRFDSITVTGVLFDFSGLLELSPTNSFINHGQATVIPSPLQLPITSAAEVHESKLVQFQNVTFVQSGAFATGNSTVQVTDGTNTLDVRINGTTNIDGAPIPSGPITITGLLGQFNANYQLIPRDLNDMITYIAPEREINVKINGSTVLSGSTKFIGAAGTIAVDIENQGVNNLAVTGSSFSGVNAADFASNITSATIGGTSSQSFLINFTPAGIGSRFATLSIGNNDDDENPYIIHFEGVGTNNLATEPSANPSNLTFTNPLPYKLTGSYTAGTNASKYIVLWKNGSPITAMPEDGASYRRGDVVGDARVAYVGSGTGFTPRGVIANQTYYFKVFAFNGQDGFENYRIVNPASETVTTPGQNIGNYYQGINSNASSLILDLQMLVYPHTQLTYFSYKTTMMSEFEIRDTTDGQSYVTCAYSGERKVFNDPFDWTPTGYSREHTFAHSWMLTFPANNPERPEYTDQHHLYPTNLQQANTPRSNLPMDDIDGNVVFEYLEGRVGYKGPQLVYEPRAAQKGNAARAIMYVALVYNFPLNGNVNSTKQSRETLVNWHFADLPDNYEIARHEYVYSLQGNRNPFIDSVHFACRINVDDNILEDVDCMASLEEKIEANFVIFPVPSSDKVFIQINGTDITDYEIVDMNGRSVRKVQGIQESVLILSAADFAKGAYLVHVKTPVGVGVKKMVIE